MEWPINYTLEKMMPLLTLWSFNCVSKQSALPSTLSIYPEEIVKRRVRHGVESLEILWSVTGEWLVTSE